MACLCGFILVRNDHFLFAQNGVVMGFLLCQNLKTTFGHIIKNYLLPHYKLPKSER